MCVVGSTHDSEVDEFGADVRVNDSDDDRGNDDEGERAFAVAVRAQSAEGGCGGILAQVAKSYRWWDDEEEGGEAGQDREGFGEVLGLFHL